MIKKVTTYLKGAEIDAWLGSLPPAEDKREHPSVLTADQWDAIKALVYRCKDEQMFALAKAFGAELRVHAEEPFEARADVLSAIARALREEPRAKEPHP